MPNGHQAHKGKQQAEGRWFVVTHRLGEFDQWSERFASIEEAVTHARDMVATGVFETVRVMESRYEQAQAVYGALTRYTWRYQTLLDVVECFRLNQRLNTSVPPPSPADALAGDEVG